MAAASVGSTNPAPPETADRTGPEGILPGQPPPGRQRRDLRGNRRSRRSPSRAARPANRRANGFSRSRAGRTAATPSRMVRTPVHTQAADSRPRRSKSPYFRTPPDVRPAAAVPWAEVVREPNGSGTTIRPLRSAWPYFNARGSFAETARPTTDGESANGPTKPHSRRRRSATFTTTALRRARNGARI